MRVAKVDSLFDPTISFVVGLSFMLSLGFGTKFILEDAMTVGDLVTFTTYLSILIGRCWQLGCCSISLSEAAFRMTGLNVF